MSFSRGSSWPRDQTQVSHIAGRFFTVWATRVERKGFELTNTDDEEEWREWWLWTGGKMYSFYKEDNEQWNLKINIQSNLLEKWQ